MTLELYDVFQVEVWKKHAYGANGWWTCYIIAGWMSFAWGMMIDMKKISWRASYMLQLNGCRLLLGSASDD